MKLEPPFGELLTPKVVSVSQFKSLRAKLGGMFESAGNVNEADVKWETSNLLKRVYRSANVSPIDNYGPASTVEELDFHGVLLTSQKPVLITVKGGILHSFFIHSSFIFELKLLFCSSPGFWQDSLRDQYRGHGGFLHNSEEPEDLLHRAPELGMFLGTGSLLCFSLFLGQQ